MVGQAERQEGSRFGVVVEERLGEFFVAGAEVFAVAGFGVEAEVAMLFEEVVEKVFELEGVPFLFLGGGKLCGGIRVAVLGDGLEESPDELVGIGLFGFFLFRRWVGSGGGWRRDAVLEGGPFVEKGGVGLADEGFEVLFGGFKVFVFERGGNGLGEDFIDLGKVAQEDGFRFFELVVFDVIFEATISLVDFAGDGFGTDVFGVEVGVVGGVVVEGLIDEVGAGFGVLDFLEFLHALVVVETVFFHLGDGFVLGAADLGAEDLAGVLEDGFDEGEDVEGVIGVFGIELGDGV